MDRHPALLTRHVKETLQNSPRAPKTAGHLCRREKAPLLDAPSGSLLFPTAKALILFGMLGLLLACSDGTSSEKVASMETRLQQLEAKSNQMEGQLKQVAAQKEQIGKLEQSVSRLEKLVAANIKPKTIAQEKKTEPKPSIHVVQRGDILSRIADSYGMSLDELCRLNNITPGAVIRPGQKLMVISKQ